MPFTSTWHELLHQIDVLSDGASMVTPLSHRCFRIANTKEQRVILAFKDEDGHRPLQREQFESLYDRIHDGPTAFALDWLPPDADPYPARLTLHPRYEINEDNRTITNAETTTVPLAARSRRMVTRRERTTIKPTIFNTRRKTDE